MRGSALAVLLVAPALLLAGCTVEPPTLQGQPVGSQGRGVLPDGSTGTQQGLDAPTIDLLNHTREEVLLPGPVWRPGDTWVFGVARPDGSGTQRLIVYGQDARDYLVGSGDPDDAALAAFHSRPFPGPISKQFLGGYTNNAVVRYFDFPLQQNKSWGLQLYGTSYQVKANLTERAEGAPGPGFEVAGLGPTGGTIRYTYAPPMKWFTRFEIHDAGGQPVVVRTLNEYRSDYTGPWYVGEARDLFLVSQTGTPVPPVQTFRQPADVDRVHLTIQANGTGAADVRFIDPAGQARYTFTATADQEAEADLPVAAGEWRVTFAVAPQMRVALRVAGITLTSGTIGGPAAG